MICVRGQGTALVGAEVHALRPFDLVRSGPWEPHRWVNAGDEPFGFLCTVDGERDKPAPLERRGVGGAAGGPGYGAVRTLSLPGLRASAPGSSSSVISAAYSSAHGCSFAARISSARAR